MERIALIMTLWACLMAPAAANAATVSVSGGVLRYVAVPGQADRLTMWRGDPAVPGDVVLLQTHGGGPTITPGANCATAADVGAVACSVPSSIEIALGDGHDFVEFNPPSLSGARGPSHAITMPVSVDAGPGADVVWASTGPATLLGGPGEDRLDGKGCDTLDGQGDADELFGGGVLIGGEGDDDLYGAGELRGGPGSDLVEVRKVDNCSLATFTLDGGTGADTLQFFDYDAVEISQDGVANDGYTDTGSADGSVAAFEAIQGSHGDDVIIGSAADEEILGNGGDDLLDGGLGADVLDGGSDTDLVTYEDRTTPVTVTVDEAAGDGAPGEGDRVLAEGVLGGDGGDVLALGPDGGVLDGGPGDDRLVAGTGSMYSDGESGLFGGPGRDVLLGGPGDDTLDGEQDADDLDAGPGDDWLMTEDGVSDRARCGTGLDLVVAEPLDVVDADCESGRPPTPATLPAPPAPTPSASTASTRPRPYFDSVAPILTVDRVSPLRLRRLPAAVRVKLRCDEPCNTGATLSVMVRSGRRLQRHIVGDGRILVGQYGWTTLSIRPTAEERRLLRRASGGTARLELVATDVIGNRTTRRVGIPLRRRG